MNKLFLSKNFYLFLWKEDRSPFLWVLTKFMIFFLAIVLLIYFVSNIYGTEKNNLEKEQNKFILIQKTLLNAKNNQAIYESNRNNIDEMKKNNFLTDINDANIFSIFKKITNDIDYPITEYFNVEPRNSIIRFGERKTLFGAKLKYQARFWHENDFINFLNKINGLNKMIREDECELSRISKREDYINSKVFLKNIEPSLEVKCTIGLYWVS
ncbi:MAG: hypothetical protein V4525_11630 [Pseudomonadota bacterium]